jgi:hypothetical protein
MLSPILLDCQMRLERKDKIMDQSYSSFGHDLTCTARLKDILLGIVSQQTVV